MAATVGLAAGFKITAMPAIVFFMALLIATGPRMPGWRRRLLRNSAIFCAAVVLSCPAILEIVPQLFKQSAATPAADIAKLFQRVLVIDRWERDAVFSGGVLRFSLMPVPLMLMVLAAMLVSWRAVVAVLLTAAIFMKMSVGSMTYYGWYWIALFPLFLYAVSRERNGATPLPLLLLFGAAISMNFFQQMPLIIDQTYQKTE